MDEVDSEGERLLWHLRIIARGCSLESSVSSETVVAVLAICSHGWLSCLLRCSPVLAGWLHPLCQGLKCYLQLMATLPGWTPPSGFRCRSRGPSARRSMLRRPGCSIEHAFQRRIEKHTLCRQKVGKGQVIYAYPLNASVLATQSLRLRVASPRHDRPASLEGDENGAHRSLQHLPCKI